MLIQHFQSSWKIPSSLKITKKSCHNGVSIEPKKNTNLTWYESQDLIFQLFFLLNIKLEATTLESIDYTCSLLYIMKP
jgi:hypothetical protein